MEYLCILHLDYAVLSNMSREGMAELERSNLAYAAELDNRRQLIVAHGLEPPENGLILRVQNDEPSTTNGRFTEAREQMAGFILIEARDMNEAAGIAAGAPLAKYGQVEIRPVTTPMQA